MPRCIRGSAEFLKGEGLNDDDEIPAENRQSFYRVTRGDRVPFLVVSNNLSKTVAPEVLKGFNTIFQQGVDLVGALSTDDTHKELKKKFEQRVQNQEREALSKNSIIGVSFGIGLAS